MMPHGIGGGIGEFLLAVFCGAFVLPTIGATLAKWWLGYTFWQSVLTAIAVMAAQIILVFLASVVYGWLTR